MPPDPLDDARALLVLAELLYRSRRAAALQGIEPADRAARAMVAAGRRLREAVARVEATPAGSAERRAALAEVARVGETLAQDIDERWESPRALFGAAIAGLQGRRRERPG